MAELTLLEQKLLEKYNKMSFVEKTEYLSKLGIDNPNATITEILIAIKNKKSNKIVDSIKSEKPRFSKTSFGKRDLSKLNHWDTDTKDFKITKPTLICLPGNGSIEAKKSNGVCGIAERLMGLKGCGQQISSTYEFIDVIGFYYGRDKESDTAGNVTENEINKFVDNLLLPLCVDKNGKSLPIKIACKNFSNLTFFTHCYGAEVLAKLMNVLNKKLLISGFSKDDVHLIMSNSFHLSYAPFKLEKWLPTVSIESGTDSFRPNLDREYQYYYNECLEGIKIKYNDVKNIEAHNSISIYSSKLLNVDSNNDLSKLIDEHTIQYLDRDYSWGLTPKSRKAKNADAVSKLAGYSLSWAVSRALKSFNGGKIIPNNNLNEELYVHLVDILSAYSENDLRK